MLPQDILVQQYTDGEALQFSLTTADKPGAVVALEVPYKCDVAALRRAVADKMGLQRNRRVQLVGLPTYFGAPPPDDLQVVNLGLRKPHPILVNAQVAPDAADSDDNRGAGDGGDDDDDDVQFVSQRKPIDLADEDEDEDDVDMEDDMGGEYDYAAAAAAGGRAEGHGHDPYRIMRESHIGMLRQEEIAELLGGASTGAVLQVAYEPAFGPVHPAFAEGTLNEALAEARKQFKFTIMYLHNPTHANTAVFCQGVLGSEPVSQILGHSFVFWAADISACDMERIQQSFGITDYPYLALISNAEGDMSILDVAQGPMQPDEAMMRYLQLQETHGHVLEAAKARAERLDEGQLLRQQQELEFEAALAEDQRREREKAEAAEREKLAAEEQERRARQAEQAKADKETRRQAAEAGLPVEPAQGAADSARIGVRLADGSRIVRRFAGADPVSAVFDFVFVKTDIDQFNLVTSFPRRVLERTETTVKDAGLCPQTMLLVEPIEDDDDDAQ